jgi:protein-S-isoprenylcysteine O-methyltransferase Ste14
VPTFATLRMSNGRLLLRSLLSVIILPVSVAVLVPLYLVRRWGAPAAGWPLGDAATTLVVLCGAVLLLGGLTLVGSTVAGFTRLGRGTLAPWDPPRRLVVSGVYRHLRNPMISGVALVLLGEGLLLRAPAVLAWALAFAALNAVWMPLVEEPGLRARFGADYLEYCRHVPRWLPRGRPWIPSTPPPASGGTSAEHSRAAPSHDDEL